MGVHVAIVTSPYDQLILTGRKVIEARLTRTDRPPFGCVCPGDRIHFKRSSGPFFAEAVAARVLMVDALTPKLISQLRQQYDQWICGDPTYWQNKRHAQFATLIWLRDVVPSTFRPNYTTQNMRAWYVLEDVADEPASDRTFVVTLTSGCLRQNYVRPGEAVRHFPKVGTFNLHLADGPNVKTDIVRGMFRWRGWRAWFKQYELCVGDRLQFTQRTRTSFDVQPIRSPRP